MEAIYVLCLLIAVPRSVSQPITGTAERTEIAHRNWILHCSIVPSHTLMELHNSVGNRVFLVPIETWRYLSIFQELRDKVADLSIPGL